MKELKSIIGFKQSIAMAILKTQLPGFAERERKNAASVPQVKDNEVVWEEAVALAEQKGSIHQFRSKPVQVAAAFLLDSEQPGHATLVTAGYKRISRASRDWADLKNFDADFRKRMISAGRSEIGSISTAPKKNRETEKAQYREEQKKAAEEFGIVDPYTEHSISLLFVKKHKHELIFDGVTSRWSHWNQAVWERKNINIAVSFIQDICVDLAITTTDPATIRILKKTATACNAELAARHNTEIARDVPAWDGYPYMLNTPDGILDLANGQLYSHDPEFLLTMMTGAGPGKDWKPGGSKGKAKAWRKFLMNAMGDAAAVRMARSELLRMDGGQAPGKQGKAKAGKRSAKVLDDKALADLEATTAISEDKKKQRLALQNLIKHHEGKTDAQIDAEAEEMFDFLMRVIGYCLIGNNKEQVLFIGWGVTRSGKSTFIEVISKMFGEFAAMASETMLMETYNDEGSRNTADIAVLKGKRLVFVDESKRGKNLNEDRIKRLTGSFKMMVKRLYENPADMLIEFSPFLMTNFKPSISGNDMAIIERLIMIPWMVYMPEHLRDTKLVDKLSDELPEIMALAIDGCVEYGRIGLAPPARVRALKEDYADDQDMFQVFIDECCTKGTDVATGKMIEDTINNFHPGYCEWARATQGARMLKRTDLVQELQDRGFEVAAIAGAKKVYGIKYDSKKKIM